MYSKSRGPGNCYTISGDKPIVASLKIHKRKPDYVLYVPVGSRSLYVCQKNSVILEKVTLCGNVFESATIDRASFTDTYDKKRSVMLRNIQSICDYSIVLCKFDRNFNLSERPRHCLGRGFLFAEEIMSSDSDTLVKIPFSQKEPFIVFLPNGCVRMFQHKDLVLEEIQPTFYAVIVAKCAFALKRFRGASPEVREEICESMRVLRDSVNQTKTQKNVSKLNNTLETIFFKDKEVAVYLKER